MNNQDAKLFLEAYDLATKHFNDKEKAKSWLFTYNPILDTKLDNPYHMIRIGRGHKVIEKMQEISKEDGL